MPVKTLRQLSQRACIANVRQIQDVGEMPYDLVRPVLLRIENPQQLADIEQACPQIRGEDAELWMDFIKRDIPNWESKPHEPRDPKNWAKVYRKLKRDVEKEEEQGAAKLAAKMKSIQNMKEENVAQIVNRARLPARRPTTHQVTMSRHYGIPSKIRRPVSSKGVTAKQMAVPMHELKKRTTKITTAPQGFLEDQKRKAAAQEFQRNARLAANNLASTSSRTAHVARVSSHIPQQQQSVQPSSLEAREARLRALTSGRPPAARPSPADPTRPSLSTTSGISTAATASSSSLQTLLPSPSRPDRPRPRPRMLPTSNGSASNSLLSAPPTTPKRPRDLLDASTPSDPLSAPPPKREKQQHIATPPVRPIRYMKTRTGGSNSGPG